MKRTRTPLLLVGAMSALIMLNSCSSDEVTIEKLITVTEELPSDNCAFGGVRIATGMDEDKDGILSEDEITEEQFVCENANSLILVTPEDAGENCANGGLKVETGMDANQDGILGEDEIDEVQYICTSANKLVRTGSETPGENCEFGGISIYEGLDDNGDGALSDDEIDDIQFICETPNMLIQTSQEAPSENCLNGGIRIESGTDTDGDNVLDTNEITSIEYYCYSVSSLVTTTNEPASTNCPWGGIRIDVGFDDNGNGLLENDEIDNTQYVCNGSGGGGGGDLLVRLEIGRNGSSNNRIHTSSSSFVEYGEDRERLTHFSKLDYPGVDSIVYAIPMRTSDAMYSCYVELYDATNDASITTLQSNYYDHDGIYETVYSGNIYDLLPSDGTRIDLGNRIASERLGTLVYAGMPAQLLLFRRNP